MDITLNAYAKINLFLDIDSIRPDGYHNIISVMQSVSLSDTVTVTYTPGGEKLIEVSCDDSNIPCGADNLAYKAAKIFPIDNGNIKIHIQKRIPVSAGLAGGSADAAAVLRALNHLTNINLNIDDLKSLGSSLGADVPFCIVGGTALATGVGEILTDFATMPKLPILIAKMGDGMSTPAAYKALDQANGNFISYHPQTEKLYKLRKNIVGDDINDYCSGMFNIFESVVEPVRKHVTDLKAAFLKLGAQKSMMSGSGTSVFAIFNDEKSALDARAQLVDMGINAQLCYPINSTP